MRTLLLWLVIPGAIIAYLVIGFFVCLLLCRIDEIDWRDEIDGCFVVMIVVWPITLFTGLFVVIIAGLFAVINPVRLLERIADVTRKGRKDE